MTLKEGLNLMKSLLMMLNECYIKSKEFVPIPNLEEGAPERTEHPSAVTQAR